MKHKFEYEQFIEANTEEMPILLRGIWDGVNIDSLEWWPEVMVDGVGYDINDRLTDREREIFDALICKEIREPSDA